MHFFAPRRFFALNHHWRWALGWSIAIVLLSCLPYLMATQMAPPGWQFAGILVNPYDGQSYLAKMRQGFDGQWLFHLTYTPEPHEGAFIFTFYLALGHLARLTGLPLIIVFHLARLIAGFILLLVSFRFINFVLADPHERRLAFILLATSSGLGWLGAIFGAFPIDLWVPEAFVPYSLFANPHFPLAMALMLLILQQATEKITEERGEKGERREEQQGEGGKEKGEVFFPLPSLFPLLSSVLLALILPFAMLTVWAVLAVYLGWQFYIATRHNPNSFHLSFLPLSSLPSLLSPLLSLPVIVYDYWVSATNPVLAAWSTQNVTLAPSALNFGLGYGLVGLLAVAGGWVIIRQRVKNKGEWLVLLWAITTLLLVYFPFFDLQRRLINGLHIPLCILAAVGLNRWLASNALRYNYRRMFTNIVVTIGALGTLFVWTIPLLGFLHPPTEGQTSALFFVRGSESVAFNWLRENSTSNSVILASPRLGMFVPGQTGGRAFYGHPFETIDAKSKKEMVEAFYRGELDTVAPLPDWIIYGPSEKALGQPKNLDEYPIVFSTQDITVYKVNKDR